MKAEEVVPAELLRVNVERALKPYGLPQPAIDELLAEVRDSLYVAMVAQAGRVEALEEAAKAEGLVGLVPGTVRWLTEKAEGLRQEGRPWLTTVESR